MLMLMTYNEYKKGGYRLAKQKLNTEKVSVFLTIDVLNELREEASKKGINVSALIRMIILDRKK